MSALARAQAIARTALDNYERDNANQPWLYNPQLDDAAEIALALRGLLEATGES